MAYGNVVGYEPGPQPGAYAFQKADGSKFLAFGAPAEDLRSRVDASQQQLAAVANNPDVTPQAIAQNAPPPTGLPADYQAASDARVASALDAGPAATIASSSEPLSSQGPPPAATLASEPNMSVAPPGAAPATEQPASQEAPPKREAVPLFRNKKGEVVYSLPGENPGDSRVLYTETKPTGGSPGGYAPSSMKISGATNAVSPADVEALRENSIDQKLAYQQSYDLNAETMAEQRAALDAQESSNAIAAREAMDRQQQMQAKADDMSAQYDQAKKDYSNASIDPDRYMKQSAGGGWLKALGMALGAAGAALAKTPNFAQQFVEKQIEYDIRAQEAAIRIKGDRQQTMLGDLQRQLGSLDLAKSAYTGVMLQESKRRLETLANHAATRESAAQYLQGAAQLDAALQANDVNFRKQAAGTVETEYRYHLPTSGSAGNRQIVSDTDAETAHRLFPEQKHAAKTEEKKAVVQDAITAADEAGAAAGLKWDQKQGEYVEGPAGSNALVGTSGYSTEARQKAHGIISANAGKFAHALGERPPSVDMVDRYAGEFFTNGPQGVLHYKSRLSALRRNLDRSSQHAGSLPDTAAERAEERGDE